MALGVLDALESCEGSYDGDQVLCYTGEDLADAYGHGVRKLSQRGRHTAVTCEPPTSHT